MSQLKARCIDQVLIFENTPVITSGNVNYDSILFDFCSAWDGFTKTAIFYRSEDEVFYQLLDGANTCIIPKEVLREKGDVYIGVFGVSGDTTLTSQVLKYKISRGAITEDLKPADPTPDIYEQIISRYDAVIEELEEQFQKLEDLQSQFTGSVGNADKLGGHAPDYFATAQSVTDLINGTTKAGKAKEADNASTLGGHEAEYFQVKNGVSYLGAPFDANDFTESGRYTHGNFSLGTNIPNTGTFIINNCGTYIIQTLVAGSKPPYQIYVRQSLNGGTTWGNWSQPLATTEDLANYLLKSNFDWGNIDNKVKYRAGSETADLNNETGGIILGQDTTGGTLHYPKTSTFFYIITLNYVDYSKKQIAIPYDTDGEIYTRTNYAGTWSEWTNPMSTISKLSGTPLNLKGSPSHSLVRFLTSGGANLGYLGFNGSDDAVVVGYDGQTRGSILHTGNSAKVVINSTAPSDTSALWIDTTA